MITPRQIAKGKDDRYMTRMAADIAETGQTVYIRLMAEMNGHWNAYSAFNADGSARRHGHSARWYRLAWRRFTLILRGGSRDKINRRLMRMGLPRILRAKSQNDPVYEGGPDGIPLPIPEQMPQPRVAMMWVPQSFGSPNIAGNQPADYWPGGATSTGSGSTSTRSSPAPSTTASRFFNRYDKWPFVIGEYGPWDNDFGGSFTGGLFRWAEAHERVKMMLYYRGVDPATSYNVAVLPRRPAALRNHLAEPHWARSRPGSAGSPTRPAPGDARARRAAAGRPSPAARPPPAAKPLRWSGPVRRIRGVRSRPARLIDSSRPGRADRGGYRKLLLATHRCGQWPAPSTISESAARAEHPGGALEEVGRRGSRWCRRRPDREPRGGRASSRRRSAA